MFLGHGKHPLFEKSAINEASFEWTGVDKNRHRWCFISHKTRMKTTYRLLGDSNRKKVYLDFFHVFALTAVIVFERLLQTE
tara:strand:- start:1314 stop:1556 length:243 start_codon:yes stop_codon:yes gene_type:complete